MPRRTAKALVSEIHGHGFPAAGSSTTDSNGVRLTRKEIYANNEKRCQLLSALRAYKDEIIKRVETVAAADSGKFREVNFEELCVASFGKGFASLGVIFEFFYLKVVLAGKAEPVNTGTIGQKRVRQQVV
jgi:hypothetical protein